MQELDEDDIAPGGDRTCNFYS